MGLQLSGGQPTGVAAAPRDPRTKDEKAYNAARVLTIIAKHIREAYRLEDLVQRQLDWLNGHKTHPNWAAHHKRYVENTFLLLDEVSFLNDAASDLQEELEGWTEKDRKTWIGAWMIPWPCVWEWKRNQDSVDETPWAAFPPF